MHGRDFSKNDLKDNGVHPWSLIRRKVVNEGELTNFRRYVESTEVVPADRSVSSFSLGRSISSIVTAMWDLGSLLGAGSVAVVTKGVKRSM